MGDEAHGHFVFGGGDHFFRAVFVEGAAKLNAVCAAFTQLFRDGAGFFEIGYADDLRRAVGKGGAVFAGIKIAHDDKCEFHDGNSFCFLECLRDPSEENGGIPPFLYSITAFFLRQETASYGSRRTLMTS